MGRWERSKQLATSSWAVVKEDKELMVLPLISGIASLAVMATFLVPIFATSRTTDALGNDTSQMGILQAVLFFAMYAVLAYVTVFFRTALLCGADERLRGGNPSLVGPRRRRPACRPHPALGTGERHRVGHLAQPRGTLGPARPPGHRPGGPGLDGGHVPGAPDPGVRGRRGARCAPRSAALLKATWGENLIVNGGLGVLSALLLLPAFALVGVGVAIGSPGAIVVTAAWAIVWVVAVVCWSSAMSAVFQLALYRYAVDGRAPGAFATVDLGHAFEPKRKGRSLLG